MLSERVEREKEELLAAPPQIDIERLEILSDIYRSTDLQPAIIRRATLFHRLCAEKAIYIDSNPIAGTLTRYKYGSNHLNMKFHPTALKGRQGARNLLSLIKTYFDLGGYHVQFNCVSAETLQEAQLHPEEHQELIVRVAGFSAYFVTLDKDVQDDIIKRTELSFSG